jgi:hypothetical protein
MKRANYNKEFGKDREKPGVGAHLLAGIIKILPKIGPLAPLKFKAPSAAVEDLYIKSFDSVQLHFSNALKSLPARIPLVVNKNLDTGIDTRPGDYRLADQTYGDLLLKITGSKSAWENTRLKQNLLHFFSSGVALGNEDTETRTEMISALDSLKK